MKIGYNYNNNLVIQEINSIPNFEFVEITPEIEIQIREMIKPILQNGLIIEGATEQEINIKNENNIIIEIKQKYEFHKSNGWEAYNEFRAKVVNDIYKGLITEMDAFYIEENLSPAFDQISATGDWKTARYKLMQVSPYPPFVQPYYDLAMQIINDYITNNYEN